MLQVSSGFEVHHHRKEDANPGKVSAALLDVNKLHLRKLAKDCSSEVVNELCDSFTFEIT